MKFENVPVPVGTEFIDPVTLLTGAGVAVVVVAVALSAPRLFTLCAIAGVIAGGAFLIG